MNTRIYIASILLAPFLSISSLQGYGVPKESVQPIFQKANKKYAENQYKEALTLYEKIIHSYPSFELYFNAGNAAYKSGQIAKAVLYYERARKINPVNEDLLYNLHQAYRLIPDKVEYITDPTLPTKVIYLLNGNSWAVTGLVLLLIGSAGLLLYFFSSLLIWRKVGFFGGIAIALLGMFMLIPAYYQWHRWNDQDSGIVMAEVATVFNEPDQTAKKMFNLHEGTKCKILKKQNNMYYIALPNGLKGWIDQSLIELI